MNSQADPHVIARSEPWRVGPWKVHLAVTEERGQLSARSIWSSTPTVLHSRAVEQLRAGREAALLALQVQLGRPVVLA